ncbi:MAG: hypothetical protein A2Y31_03520 [Spirochaetes bacterium GWC2_52_13]|nr:MAG: hypothetical protein A2Y31_03520 [Spirochaetes bacterium GWC2_52_13]
MQWSTLPSECRQREVTEVAFHAKRSERKGTMQWSTLPSECRQREVTEVAFHAKRSERKGTMQWSLSRASAGNVRIHTSPLGADKEA